MNKHATDLIISELSILHEISSLCYRESGPDFLKEAVEKATRIFNIRRFAIVTGADNNQKTLISLGFSGHTDLKPYLYTNPNWFRFSFEAAGGPGVILMEQSSPLKSRELRLYTIFARKVEEGIMAQEAADRKERAEQERLDMERKLLHAQRLQSLGILAGGIAHDFNNLLTAMLGHMDIALLNLPPTLPPVSNISHAKQAAVRAAELTRQLLAYSGKGNFIKAAVDLSALVEENAHLLKTSLTKSVNLKLDLAKDLPAVLIDPGQGQQVVMNLITNAAEAVGERKGTVTLATGVEFLEEAYLDRSILGEKPARGRFVYLEVSDTGCGMDQQTLERIFDPFFTTKYTGRGLGMSAIQGIVTGHKGAMMVESTVGEGTSVKVLFPAPAAYPAQRPVLSEPACVAHEPVSSSPSGMILVIDDDEVIRDLCKIMLEHLGFTVLTAANGIDGLEAYREYAAEIVCVVLDLTMPTMDGVATFQALRDIDPGVKVLLSSGYGEEEAVGRFVGAGLAGFLQKPYMLQTLHSQLKQLLKPSCEPYERRPDTLRGIRPF